MFFKAIPPFVILAAGCYMRGHPAAGVDASMAGEWGCKYEQIHAVADSLKGRPSEQRIPEAGWTACHVLAAIGAPDSTSISRSGGESVATWCYRNYAGAIVRQVLFVRHESIWLVDAITQWHELSLKTC
jgi:hypothetical protein